MLIDDVIAAYPSLRGDAEYTDSDALSDFKEWALGAKRALDDARVVYAEHIVLKKQLEAKKLEHERALKDVEFFKREAEGAGAELRELRVLVDEAERERKTLTTQRDDLSARYNRVADELQALNETHEKVVSDAERWTKESERTIARLVIKIKRLESNITIKNPTPRKRESYASANAANKAARAKARNAKR